MCTKASFGFSMLVVSLLVGFQLLWGLKWITYYVRVWYPQRHRYYSQQTGEVVRVDTTIILPQPQNLEDSPEQKTCSSHHLLEYPKDITPRNLPPVCEENERYVASPVFCNRLSTPFLFILVMSAVGHFNERHGQRHLLLRSRFSMAPKFIAQHSWKYVFLVGKPNSKYKIVNEKIQRKVEEESCRFKDILQVDVLENYYNLNMKKMTAFDFLIQNNIKFEILLKTDDDCFVNIQLVMEWLTAEAPPAYDRIRDQLKKEGKSVSNSTKYFFGGLCSKTSTPNRNPESKYYLSTKDYKAERFPPVCYGPGYFLSYDTMKAIATFPGNQLRSFRQEDVHTGLIVSKLGIITKDNVKSTKRVQNVWTGGSRCILGEYPFIVMAGRYPSVRLLYNDFMKRRTCRNSSGVK
eukprot:m.259892 g.259892  ORF g.259892 m.259892 type:complete len:406 (+) comp40428_c0_seq36:142-1359(+)